MPDPNDDNRFYSLEQADRVDIQGPVNTRPQSLSFQRLNPGVQPPMQCRSLPGTAQQLRMILPAAPEHRAFHRIETGHTPRLAGETESGESLQKLKGCRLMPCAHPPKREMGIGWKSRLLSLLQLVPGKTLIVMLNNRGKPWMPWKPGLNQDLALLSFATRASRHLDQLLYQLLGRAEIETVQALVRVDDQYQLDPGKIMPLAQQLRTDQDVDLT